MALTAISATVARDPQRLKRPYLPLTGSMACSRRSCRLECGWSEWWRSARGSGCPGPRAWAAFSRSSRSVSFVSGAVQKERQSRGIVLLKLGFGSFCCQAFPVASLRPGLSCSHGEMSLSGRGALADESQVTQ